MAGKSLMRKDLKRFLTIGLMMLTSVLGYGMGQSKGVMVNTLSSHSAEYWFEDQKDVEFCHAIEWDDTGKMARLMKEGVEINKQSKRGITFLVYAYLKDSKRSFEFLLKNGANPNILMNLEEKIPTGSMFKFQDTLLTMAAEDSYDSFYLEMGLKYGGNPNLVVDKVHILYFAIRAKKFNSVKLLIEAGADVDGLEKEGAYSTPLSHAILGRNYYMAYYLLQKGANPELAKNFLISMMGYPSKDEYYVKVKKMLEARGFDFSEENIKRIRSERQERERRWRESH